MAVVHFSCPAWMGIEVNSADFLGKFCHARAGEPG